MVKTTPPAKYLAPPLLLRWFSRNAKKDDLVFSIWFWVWLALLKPTVPAPPRPQTSIEISWSRLGTRGNSWANMTTFASLSQLSLLTFPLSSTTLLDKAELRLILTEIWEPGARDSRKPVRRTGELVVSPAHRSHTDVCLKIFHGIVYHLYLTSPVGDFTMTRSSAHTQIMRYLYLLNV